MFCPACGLNEQHHVISSRRNNPEYILRRHECVCGHKFNSVEITGFTEKNMKIIEREMNKNCQPRQFQKMIHSMYRQIFDRHNWLQEKKRGSDVA